eukprot:571658-Pleurochrysis_carterae.AAC.1
MPGRSQTCCPGRVTWAHAQAGRDPRKAIAGRESDGRLLRGCPRDSSLIVSSAGWASRSLNSHARASRCAKERAQPGLQVAKTPGGEQLTGRVEGVEHKRRCRAVRRRRVKQRIISNKVAKVARPDPVHPRL